MKFEWKKKYVWCCFPLDGLLFISVGYNEKTKWSYIIRGNKEITKGKFKTADQAKKESEEIVREIIENEVF